MRGMSEGQGEFQTTKKAFTLVELIIVITILAILATIAFVSFSNYTASSRDTKRISSLVNIEK
jgi:prepilin-type N-terminal cleavage/methylation domain-containing protein